MGSSSSKPDRNEALVLCKERLRYIKQAIDSRYALSAAHLSYIQSLRSVGTALKRFVEEEVLMDSSLSISEPDKSPSHSSYASPSPSRFPEHVGSPLHSASPLSPRLSNISYMRATRSNAVTVAVNPVVEKFVGDDSLNYAMPPPPPPPPEMGSSWDFFFSENGELGNGENISSLSFNNWMGVRQFKEEAMVHSIEEVKSFQNGEDGKLGKVVSRDCNENANSQLSSDTAGCRSALADSQSLSAEKRGKAEGTSTNGSAETLGGIASSEPCKSKGEEAEIEMESCQERKDPSEFITHRAKDFLSSVKDIEHRFLRAAESGGEVSRMLETSKIRLGVLSKTAGRSSVSLVLSALHPVCCKPDNGLDHDTVQHVTKVITWNRSVSSRSSSSKNPLTSASKDDNSERGSDFIEEFCMISGSHSSTLDRLYAWERKLYDEVKASETIRKAYDQKCVRLRHQFARDMNVQVIDKTRAVVKDLHSRLTVALYAVDSISKRIEKLRDDELQPQLIELIQGLIRMWRAMLECHHAQYITISLAYNANSSTTAPQSEARIQALIHLQSEMDCFGASFANWISAHKAYVDALNNWLQKCILQPPERSRGRKVIFSPRRALAPPIFVICRDWLGGINSLPSEELCNSIQGFLTDLHASSEQKKEEKQTDKRSEEVENDVELIPKESKEEEKCQIVSNLGALQPSLTRVFDRLSKFAEASLKVYEEVKKGSEAARAAYSSGRCW